MNRKKVATFLSQNWRWLVASLLVATLFVGFRWFNLHQNLLFFNDIGRDYLVLHTWLETGKPPLLGPQTSALPYNQSAIYFYTLFPLFVLTNQWPLASTLTITLTYLLGFGLGLYWLYREDRALSWAWIAFFGLLAVQPTLLEQHRFVWNPSFVAFWLGLAFIGWRKLDQDFTWFWVLVFGFSLSIATAFSYSVVPLALAWGMFTFIRYWSKWRQILAIGLSVAIGFLLANAPTLVFEIRHSFFLTKLLFDGEKLSQSNLHWLDRSQSLLEFSVYPSSWIIAGVVFGLSLGLIAWSVVTDPNKARFSWTRDALYLVGLTYVATLLVPVAIQKHYIFGFLSLWLLTLSGLRPKALVVVGVLLSAIWLQPTQIESLTRTPYRTIDQTRACAEQVCGQLAQPLFVSNQSSHHPYHNAMEFKYFFSWAGCDVKEIDTERDQASTLLVVLDDSEYTHGQTAFNELTQFGASEEINRITCNPQLEVVVLKAVSSETEPKSTQ